MAVLGYGIDVVDVARFERVWKRFGDRLLDRVFSDAERVWCLERPNPAIHLAARFGAKEAFVKAFGSREGIRWKDVEVVRDAGGRPCLNLHGNTRRKIKYVGVKKTHVSISHDAGISVAGVILEN